jgi:malate:Na+ symporter
MQTATVNSKKSYKILGFSLPVFAILTAVILGGTFFGVLPKGMIGAYALMLVIGAIFGEIGDHLPVVKSFLGGGPIIIIFGAAALVAYKALPKAAIDNMTVFMKDGGFLDFYIAALITGSILGMSRDLLVKAAVRYLPAILGGVVVALGLVGIVGAVSGYGAKEAIFYIGVPIMGGGMGAGAVPLAKIFGSSMATDPAVMLSKMVPAVALGNALAIVFGGLLDRLGKVKKNLTGNGELMVIKENAVVEKDEVKKEFDIKSMATGALLSLTFFVWGSIFGKLVPDIHGYAWMIISVAVVKSFGILPRKYEEAAYDWFQFIMANFTGVLLVGIGVAYTNLNDVIAAITPIYVLLVGVTVLGAVIGSAFMGKLVGFFPIESAITAGLCMANMGGTGDVAVLSAANRMKLMPFAQISSRLGGAFILLLASLLIKVLG